MNKLALLDHTAETFSKTNPTFSDEIPFIHFHEPEHIFSVIVCGIVSDIAVELRKYYYQQSGVGFETPHQQFCLQDLLEYRFVNAGLFFFFFFVFLVFFFFFWGGGGFILFLFYFIFDLF